LRRIILGSILTFFLLVSSYMTVIFTLELITEKALVRSVVFRGHENSSSFVMLRMGDVLSIVAEVDNASNAYLLVVQNDVGEAFSRQGMINGSHVEVGVPLCPPSFEVGKSYLLFFHVYAINYPLPGATIFDTEMAGFTVAASETRLSFEVSYDGVFRCLDLWANLTNVDGCPVVDETVDFYMRPVSDRSRLTYGWIPIGSAKTNDDGSIRTNQNGVAVLTWTYAVGPWAFVAEVATGQSMISSPVMLTAAKETGLSLDVEQGESNYEYTFSGYLLSYGEAVLYRQVKILVNGTVEAVLATNPDGSFSATLDLQPADDKLTAYNVQAVFEGDEPCSATAYALTPNGTEYAVCTTVQYGLKPSTNSTWLTVEPRSTQVIQPTKTSEQLQAEAEDSGWLSVYSEWSWWYPWYRLHYNFTMNDAKIDVGFNPVLPGGETTEFTSLESALPQPTAEPGLTPEEIAQITEEAVTEAAIGVLVASSTAIAAANARIPFATAVALVVYGGFLTAMIAYAWSLYSSGALTKAKAFLAGLIVDLWGVALATFMSVRAAFITEMVAAIIGAAFSSLFDASTLKVTMMSATAALYASVCIGIAALILVPEPSSIAFKLIFPSISLLFSAIAFNILSL
jgi:hypothetical protein